MHGVKIEPLRSLSMVRLNADLTLKIAFGRNMLKFVHE